MTTGTDELTDIERVALATARAVLDLLESLDPDARRVLLLAFARLLTAHRGGKAAGDTLGVRIN